MDSPQHAYVLHRRPYRETSLLVELLTAEAGRIGVVARGARRARKQGYSLEPFRLSRVTWGRKGELGHLHRIEPLGGTPELTAGGVYLGFYLNELLIRLCPRFDPCPGLFHAYAETLGYLGSEGHDSALRFFEVQLLQELGLAPNWRICARCDAPVQGQHYYRFESEIGLICGHCTNLPRPFSGYSIQFLEHVVVEFSSGESETTRERLGNGGSDADRGGLEVGLRKQARNLMRAALAPYLGRRPLKSRELLRKLQRSQRRSWLEGADQDSDDREGQDR